MKKIVIFSDWFIPGFKAGGPIQSVYRMALLLSKQFEVYVFTSAYDLGNTHEYEGIKTNTWIKLNDNLNVKYLNKNNINFREIKLTINEFKDSIFILNGVFSIFFSIIPLVLLKNSKNVFVFTRGMLHSSALSVKPFKKQVFLGLSKIIGIFKNVQFIATNEEEKIQIIKYFPQKNIKILPNVPIEPANSINLKEEKLEELKIMFLGRISPEKNPLTLIKALQNIKINVQLTICGTSINIEYKENINRELKNLPSNIKVVKIDEIEHTKVLGLLKSQDLMILPSLGENFGHAIYESLSVGVPVIIGNNTPWNHVETKNAGYIINPKDYIKLQSLIQNFNKLTLELQNDLKKNALNVAKKYYFEQDFEKEYQNVFS